MKKRILILFALVVVLFQSAISQPNNDVQTKYKAPKGKIDSTKVFISKWKLADDLISKRFTKVDTSYDMAHIYIPFYQTSISNSYLGNYGQAGRSNIYVQPDRTDLCLFSRYYAPYLTKAEDFRFYNTNKPYANVIFNTSSTQTDQQVIDVMYTQNITPVWNAGFAVKGYSSKGQFNRQATNGLSTSIFTSYEGKYYSLHAAVSDNSLAARLNGGVVYSEKTTDLTQLGVYLSNSSSRIQKRTGLFVQTLSLGQTKMEKISDTVTRSAYFKPWVQITHELQYDRDSYAYQDDNTSQLLFDSLYYRKIENKLQIRFNEDWNQYFKIGLRGGIFHELYDIYNFKFNYLSDKNTDSYSTAGVYAGLFNHKSQTWDWEGTAKYMLTGYYQNNFELKANLNKIFRFKRDSLIFNAEFTSLKKRPDYFEQTFHSDSGNVHWENNFQDKIESHLKAEISNPKHLFSAGINYGQFKNFVYMDSLARPTQYSKNFSLMTIYLNKTFRLWKFRVAGRAAYQMASSNVAVSVPKIAAFGALYYEDVLFKVMFLQLGGDVYYHTAFYQPNFAPITGQFYEQRSLLSKEEPLYDIFLNFRLKRAVVYLKMENVTKDFSSSAYFPLEKYPVQTLLFKYGVIWKFHN